MRNVFSALRSNILKILQRPTVALYISNHIHPGTDTRTRAMSATTNGVVSATPTNAPRKLKILMLHGYTQSGPIFHAKTRALEKILIKSFPSIVPPPTTNTANISKKPRPPPPGTLPNFPGGVQLFYPTAPLRLLPADIPGYTPKELDADGGADEQESDSWGWWKRETGSGLYTGLDEGLETILQAIEEAGGIDGVIGFSQGAAAAAFVASLLEPSRKAAFSSIKSANAEAYAYPHGWENMAKRVQEQGGLKFAVSYSGFFASHEAYKAFYEPKINTPVLNVIGSLDTVVEESRCLALAHACVDSKTKVVYHPGGHFVPIGKEMAGVLVGFIRECVNEDEKEESVEDMDVPF